MVLHFRIFTQFISGTNTLTKMRLLLVSEDDLKRLIADAPEYCKETDYMCDERGQQPSSSMVLRRTVEKWALGWFSKWDQDYRKEMTSSLNMIGKNSVYSNCINLPCT